MEGRTVIDNARTCHGIQLIEIYSRSELYISKDAPQWRDQHLESDDVLLDDDVFVQIADAVSVGEIITAFLGHLAFDPLKQT